jgi:hypothetical protein
MVITAEELMEALEASSGRASKRADDGATESGPFALRQVLIRTVTFFYTGRIVAVAAGFVQLADAAWIADTGRYAQTIADGVCTEVEPIGTTFISIASIVEITPWNHLLPQVQK